VSDKHLEIIVFAGFALKLALATALLL